MTDNFQEFFLDKAIVCEIMHLNMRFIPPGYPPFHVKFLLPTAPKEQAWITIPFGGWESFSIYGIFTQYRSSQCFELFGVIFQKNGYNFIYALFCKYFYIKSFKRQCMWLQSVFPRSARRLRHRPALQHDSAARAALFRQGKCMRKFLIIFIGVCFLHSCY